jgi:hypothetical protein
VLGAHRAQTVLAAGLARELADGCLVRLDAEAGVYARIVATDEGTIEVELTEDAMRHGLAIALPELVKVVLARPARLELTTFWSATRCSIH